MQEDVFVTEIKQIDWDDILQCEKNDTNHSFSSFNDTIEKLLDRRKITKKEFKQKYKPWVTNGILKSTRRRVTLLKKFIRTKKQIRKQIIHNEYNTLRNQILDLTR